ncbi:MAG: universal stress protein [Bacteroidales bacterium]
MKIKKIKKVLIPLDYDPSSQKVAEKGFALAETMGAEVVLLHVLIDLSHYSLTYMNMGPLQLDTVVELKQASLDFLEKTKLRLGNETIQILVIEGDFAESILTTAKDLNVDVIVMGSHSKSWLGNIVIGSVTEKVFRNITIPLFIIPIKKNK